MPPTTVKVLAPPCPFATPKAVRPVCSPAYASLRPGTLLADPVVLDTGLCDDTLLCSPGVVSRPAETVSPLLCTPVC